MFVGSYIIAGLDFIRTAYRLRDGGPSISALKFFSEGTFGLAAPVILLALGKTVTHIILSMMDPKWLAAAPVNIRRKFTTPMTILLFGHNPNQPETAAAVRVDLVYSE